MAGMDMEKIAIGRPEGPLTELPIRELWLHILQGYSNIYTCGVLYATGNTNFYPFVGEAAENYERETNVHSALFSPEMISNLLGQSQESVEARGLVRKLMRMYLETATLPIQMEIEKERRTAAFWKPIFRQAPAAKDVLERYDEDGSLWQRYEAFRGAFLLPETSDEDIRAYTPVFDAVERAASRQNARWLLETARLVRSFGLSFEKFIEIQLGQDPATLFSDANEIARTMRGTLKFSHGAPAYLIRQKEALQDVPNAEFPDTEWQEAIEQSLSDLGIPLDSWQNSVATITRAVPGHIGAYYPIPYLPNLVGSYPDLDQDPVWNIVRTHTIVLVCSSRITGAEGVRQVFHEHGHALEAFLSGLPISGRPQLLNEVFSFFQELRMPQPEYAIARERFLITRFAALTIHELNIWKKAFEVADAPDDQAVARIAAYAEQSYNHTLGRTLSCRVPTGRALRDFFTPTNPGVPASYTLGMLMAASLRTVATDAHDLTQAATATTMSETAREVLEKLGISWDEALLALQNLFR